jgi:hypothetical protein
LARFFQKRIRATRAFSALGADAQLLTQVPHPAHAICGGFTDVSVGHLTANADVHGCSLFGQYQFVIARLAQGVDLPLEGDLHLAMRSKQLLSL